jgi:hypothetical protein
MNRGLFKASDELAKKKKRKLMGDGQIPNEDKLGEHLQFQFLE